ncbi:hypothetical protein M885DRAFT_215216 [Pelagophyceae sp. CCMP2097]|nr:hypothetical protein M885DRAFT_215216 [Pelagophyceae sp. CCMP2097]
MASFSGSAADMLKSMGAAVPDQMPQTSLEESQAAKAKYDAAKAAEACADEDCGVDHAHAHVHTADCSHDHGHGHAAVEPAADKGHGHGHGHSETPAVVAYEGTAKGKYAWDGAGGKSKAADGSAGSAITDYAWGDGKKVSVYVDLVGLDAVSDGALSVEVVSPRKVVFTAQMPGGTRVLSLAKLEGDVTKATFIRKLGKDRVVLKLVKAEQEEWHQLNDGQAGGGDDEEGAPFLKAGKRFR